jgi:uncharacterized membrane protein (DUF106 family)
MARNVAILDMYKQNQRNRKRYKRVAQERDELLAKYAVYEEEFVKLKKEKQAFEEERSTHKKRDEEIKRLNTTIESLRGETLQLQAKKNPATYMMAHLIMMCVYVIGLLHYVESNDHAHVVLCTMGTLLYTCVICYFNN